MQGLLCKALETFVLDRHGSQVWDATLTRAGFPNPSFEMFQTYPPGTVAACSDAAAVELSISQNALMEDLGTWICTHPPLEPVRRLIRFSGETYKEMLYALDAIHDRGNLAMPGLDLPVLELSELGQGKYCVFVDAPQPGMGAFILGVLRAMADDYGSLVFVELLTSANMEQSERAEISIQLFDEQFAAPRAFNLGGAA
jgi:hypothetical protein